jgi:hypothetical protein
MNEVQLFNGVDDLILQQFGEIKVKVLDITIDQDTIFEATDWAKRIITLKKDTDTAKKAAVAPLKDAIAEVEAPYKNLIAEVEKLEVMFRQKITAYHLAEKKKEEERLKAGREKQLAELAAAQAEASIAGRADDAQALQKAIDHTEDAPVEAKSVVRGFKGTSSSLRKSWKFEVLDPAAVPREYCEPSDKKIRAAVAEGARNIAGVRIWLDEQAVIR